MLSFEIVADDNNLCGEGPIWDAQGDCLHWTDIRGFKFYRWDRKTSDRAILLDGFEIYGFALDESGGFVAANSGGVWLWKGTGKPRLLLDRVGDEPCPVNDCIADPEGRLLIGTSFYDPQKEYRRGRLISIGREGAPSVLDEGFHLSNGLGFSPDHRTLYFSDSITRLIYRYDYDAKTGAASNRRIFARVPDAEGLPDGLTVDADGFVWSAQWYGKRIVRYDPEGKVERQIEAPAKQTSSLAFGGPDLTDIFITTAGQSVALPVMPPGYDPVNGLFGGPLYRINLGIQGKPEFKTRFDAAAAAY